MLERLRHIFQLGDWEQKRYENEKRIHQKKRKEKKVNNVLFGCWKYTKCADFPVLDIVILHKASIFRIQKDVEEGALGKVAKGNLKTKKQRRERESV